MRSIAGFALLTAALVSNAAADSYAIAPGGENEVVFRSEAPLESFEGRTVRVRGSVDLDWADPVGTARIRVAVDLASLDTGMDLRNTHMRENHLHTDEFPEAVFSARGVHGLPAGSSAPSDTLECSVTGDFSLHGVTKTLTVPITIIPHAGGGLVIESRFDVSLAEYEIPRPKFLFLKLDDTQQIRIHLVATPEAKQK